jgi:type II secretory pathway component GspD/PulD (secretin)
MEDREAQTVVGTRLGFRVTTTINQVTSESIEFLETGIILKVTPSVDRQGMILLDIHPEVSDGSVSDDGIPSKTTTQLSTRMLVPDGQTVFLGGLIKRNVNESREGVPVLGDLPGLGILFSNRSENVTATEIVVLITPRVIDFRSDEWNRRKVEAARQIEQGMQVRAEETGDDINELTGTRVEPMQVDVDELTQFRTLTDGL